MRSLKTAAKQQQTPVMNKQNPDKTAGCANAGDGPAVTCALAHSSVGAGGALYLVYLHGAVVAALDMTVPYPSEGDPDIPFEEEHDTAVAEMSPAVENLLQGCVGIANGDIVTAVDLFAAMADTVPHMQGRSVYVTRKPESTWWEYEVGDLVFPDDVPYLFMC